jgi:hypothetical protein
MAATTEVVATQADAIDLQFTNDALISDVVSLTRTPLSVPPPNQPYPSAEAVQSPIPLGTKGSSFCTLGARPPHSYSSLVKQALSEESSKRLSFRQICEFIEGNYEYYRKAPRSWKVRRYLHPHPYCIS